MHPVYKGNLRRTTKTPAQDETNADPTDELINRPVVGSLRKLKRRVCFYFSALTGMRSF